MKIAITSDSTIDLSKELLQEFDIKILPLQFILGDNVYRDGDLTNEQIFEFVNNGGALPKTSAENSEGFKEFFIEILKEYDAIIHFDISSDISSTYNNARIASLEFDGKVEVIDSKNLTTGIALLAIYARKLTKTESDIKLIAEKVKERIPYVQTSFVVERLDYLHKGGRCSSVALLGANILKIRPQIVLKDGKMGSGKKFRGPMPMVVSKYCSETFVEFNNPDKSVIFITYSSATPEMIKAAYDVVNQQGFKTVYETKAGGIVSSHCGENTLGIIYINDGKTEE
ncbi:MAG: DegV family protein [Clostridia bacterium]|nr:DegV family protein [Clostridia bacterium]